MDRQVIYAKGCAECKILAEDLLDGHSPGGTCPDHPEGPHLIGGTMTPTFETKDSGKREQFASGMVRDTQEGKPRFDLVYDGPLARHILLIHAPGKSDAINAFFDWYESPSIGAAARAVLAIAVLEGGLFEFMSRCSSLMIRGAIKYAERNWMQANGEAELKRFASSACRHFGQYILGFTDEDHAAATWFNLNGAEYVRAKLAA